MLQDGIKEKGVCFDCWSELDLELYRHDMETSSPGMSKKYQRKLELLEEE